MKDILKTPYNRKELIDFIIEHSGEEFETLTDVWEVAKETDSELAGRVERIIEYQIEEGEIDTDELKTDFNEYLYSKGYDYETVWSYTDEHFENLLSFEENEKNFVKWLQD